MILGLSSVKWFILPVLLVLGEEERVRVIEYLTKAWVSTPRGVEFVHNSFYDDKGLWDANGDGVRNVVDIITTINNILGTTPALGNTDCNGDGIVNMQDVICITNGIFLGSEGELQDAISTVDEYLVEATECAKSIYPKLSDRINALNGLEVVVVFPDLFNSKTRAEGFTCSASTTGCTGLYKEGRASILITPSLAALGHEMGHWINDELFGGTDHSSQDLSIQCSLPRICHLYSINRSLDGC